MTGSFSTSWKQRKDLRYGWKDQEPVNVEWVSHPNWFFRISKYTMPMLRSRFVPETHFVHELPVIPDDLENYVLKPCSLLQAPV